MYGVSFLLEGCLYRSDGQRVTTYVYDTLNRLTSVTAGSVSASYGCDANGNRISVSERVSGQNGTEAIQLSEGVAGGEISRYNGFNQLVETTLDGVAASYGYAPSGLRVSKTVNGTATSFVLDGDQVVLESQGRSTTALYVRGINLIGNTEAYYLANNTEMFDAFYKQYAGQNKSPCKFYKEKHAAKLDF